MSRSRTRPGNKTCEPPSIQPERRPPRSGLRVGPGAPASGPAYTKKSRPRTVQRIRRGHSIFQRRGKNAKSCRREKFVQAHRQRDVETSRYRETILISPRTILFALGLCDRSSRTWLKPGTPYAVRTVRGYGLLDRKSPGSQPALIGGMGPPSCYIDSTNL